MASGEVLAIFMYNHALLVEDKPEDRARCQRKQSSICWLVGYIPIRKAAKERHWLVSHNVKNSEELL